MSPTGDDILAGSRPGRRGTLVSAKAPKAICACAIAHKRQRVALHASSSQGVRRRAFLRSRCPCFARKTGAHRPWCARSPGRGFTGSPPIIRLAPVPAADARNSFRASSSPLFASLGAWLGERRPKNTNSKHSAFGPGLRLRPSLGSSKGIKKNQFKPTRHASRFTNFGPPSSVPGPCCISSLPPGTYNLLLSLSLSPHTFPPPEGGGASQQFHPFVFQHPHQTDQRQSDKGIGIVAFEPLQQRNTEAINLNAAGAIIGLLLL